MLFASWTPLEPYRPPRPRAYYKVLALSPDMPIPQEKDDPPFPHPPPTSSPISWTNRLPPVLSLTSFSSCLPVKLFKQANRNFLWAPGSTRPPVSMKPAFHSPSGSLPSRVQPRGALHAVWQLSGYVTDKLLCLSSSVLRELGESLFHQHTG